MATFCPYCDEEIENTIHKKWIGDSPDYLEKFDFECPKCGKGMEIDVEQSPDFIAHKKSA